MPPAPRRVMKLPITADRNVLRRKSARSEERMRVRERVAEVAGEKGEREREKAEDRARRERVLAEDLEDVGEEADAAAEEDASEDVQPGHAFGAVVREAAHDEGEAEEADRDVDEEDDPPVEVADDEAAGDGPEHRPDERRDRHERHRAHEVGLLERAHDREAPDRHHERAAHALQDPERDEDVDVRREAAEERSRA